MKVFVVDTSYYCNLYCATWNARHHQWHLLIIVRPKFVPPEFVPPEFVPPEFVPSEFVPPEFVPPDVQAFKSSCFKCTLHTAMNGWVTNSWILECTMSFEITGDSTVPESILSPTWMISRCMYLHLRTYHRQVFDLRMQSVAICWLQCWLIAMKYSAVYS